MVILRDKLTLFLTAHNIQRPFACINTFFHFLERGIFENGDIIAFPGQGFSINLIKMMKFRKIIRFCCKYGGEGMNIDIQDAQDYSMPRDPCILPVRTYPVYHVHRC